MMKIQTFFKVSLIIMSIAYLSACSILSPVKVCPQSTYLLDALPCDVPQKRNSGTTLMVMPPEAVPAYNTTQMAYAYVPYQVAYFGRSRWAETPGQMLQPLLVQTLQKTHHYHAIVTPPFAGRYDYVLTTQILEVLQNYNGDPACFEIAVRAQLIRVATGRVIATRQFFVSEPIVIPNAYDGVVAGNIATRHLLSEIAYFTIVNTR